jgi:hypothetical protein
MKKAVSSGMLIVIVLALLVAGVTLYAFGPRMEKTESVIESIVGEKCLRTGQTADEYLVEITKALSGKKPDIDLAVSTNKEMKACFGTKVEAVVLRKFLHDFCKGIANNENNGGSKCSGYKSAIICNEDVCEFKNCRWSDERCIAG